MQELNFHIIISLNNNSYYYIIKVIIYRFSRITFCKRVYRAIKIIYYFSLSLFLLISLSICLSLASPSLFDRTKLTVV